MQGKKAGKNYVKKFVLVSTKAEFDKIPYSRSPYFEQKRQKNQEEIVVPKFEGVLPIVLPKNKQIPLNYLKTISVRKFMNPTKYQIDEIDKCFLEHFWPDLREEIFGELIKKLEFTANREGYEFNYKTIMKKVLIQNNFVLDKAKQQDLMKAVYLFWRNKRKSLGCPLLRIFWTKTEVGPFKNRDVISGSHGLRNRFLKIDSQEISQIVKFDLLALKQILIAMKEREQCEKRILEKQMVSFQKSCKRVMKKMLTENSASPLNEQDEKDVSRKKNREKTKQKSEKSRETSKTKTQRSLRLQKL